MKNNKINWNYRRQIKKPGVHSLHSVSKLILSRHLAKHGWGGKNFRKNKN